MSNPTNIKDAINELEQVAKYIFPKFYAKENIPSMKIEGELGENEETDSDLRLELDDWLIITPYHTTEKYKTIRGEKTRKVIGYSFSVYKLVRGVRYYPDGSGEPDFIDVVEITKLDKPITSSLQAIIQAIKFMVDNQLDQISEIYCENQMIEEAEQFSKEFQEL